MLEGLDGAGTTTQLGRMDKLLCERGIGHMATCEPTDGPIGALIRQVLKKTVIVQPETLGMLFAADRQEHLHKADDGVLAQTAAGKLVICDRYLFSSLAYQSVTTSMELARRLNSRFPLPEIVIYLDTPVDVCLARRSGRGTEELFEQAEFQTRVARAYRAVLDAHRKTGVMIAIIDGTQPPEKITDEIWKIIARLPIIKG